MLLNVYYTVVCVTLPALLANFNFAEKERRENERERTKETSIARGFQNCAKEHGSRQRKGKINHGKKKSVSDPEKEKVTRFTNTRWRRKKKLWSLIEKRIKFQLLQR